MAENSEKLINALDKAGATWLVSKTKTELGKKVDKEDGKGLYPAKDATKLAGIEAGAQVNKIETIRVNGVTAAITNKTVDVTMPDAGELNKINTVKVNGTVVVPDDNKAVDISVPTAIEINTAIDGKIETFETSVDTKLDKKVDKVDGKGLSTNDYTTTEKEKLAGISENANNYVHPTATAADEGLYKVTVDGTGHVKKTSTVTKADITALGVPEEDTTYSKATTAADGLMAKEDKAKIDGIAANAQVNSIESVSVNGTTVTPNGAKNVNISVITSDQVDAKIAAAVGAINSFDAEKVDSLPATGVEHKVYLVPHVHGSDDNFDEYMWIGGKWEKIGNTDIDLTAYAKTSDFQPITTAELEAMWNAA